MTASAQLSVRDLMAAVEPPRPPAIPHVTPWWEQPLVGLDLEATHPNPEDARIVAAAIVRVDRIAMGTAGGLTRPTRAATWLVDPGVEIPADATAVHGITTARVRADGMAAPAAVAAILDALERALYPTATRPRTWPALVAFNARYDLTTLDREARRYGLVPLAERGELLVVDPFVLDRWLDRYRPAGRKLADACAHYHVELAGAHDATFDARAAVRLAWRLGRTGQVVRKYPDERHELAAEWARVRRDLRALHPAQVRWAAEQARDLAGYFADQGNPREVPAAWPIIPHA